MRADIDTDLWRAFVAVADQGGFSRAARLLNRTQSAVSMQIRRLEDVTRTRLLERGGRVRTTPEGEALLGYARRILALNDEALERLAGDRLAGTVRLGAMDDYATEVLPPVLARFMAAHPGVRVEVQTGLTAEMLPRLGTDFDLVLAMHPAGSGRGEVLRREAAVWAAAAPDGAAAERDPLPLALYPQGCLFRRWALAALDTAGRRWHLAYVSPSLGAVAAAVAAGLAVTVGKAGTLPPALRRLGPDDGLPPLPPVEIALHRAPGDLPRAAARLGDVIAAGLRDDRAL